MGNSNRKCMIDVGNINRIADGKYANDMHICNYYNIFITRYDINIIKSTNETTINELQDKINIIKNKERFNECNCNLININYSNSLQFNKKISLILIFNLLILIL